jgi:hypothetical protein
MDGDAEITAAGRGLRCVRSDGTEECLGSHRPNGRIGELGARADAELSEDVAEVEDDELHRRFGVLPTDSAAAIRPCEVASALGLLILCRLDQEGDEALKPDRIWRRRERSSFRGSAGLRSGLSAASFSNRMQATVHARSPSSSSEASASSSSATAMTGAEAATSDCCSLLRMIRVLDRQRRCLRRSRGRERAGRGSGRRSAFAGREQASSRSRRGRTRKRG